MSFREHHRPDTEVTVFQGIATVSPQMFSFFDLLRRVARTDASVLIRGQTGTGKELVARAIHALGPRSQRSFRAINCATLTAELLASELFGHVRGAFTGAYRDRQGLFAAAHRGTIFLDEVAELPLELQARLLRVLQERSFIPVGATEPISADVRLVSATHKALRKAVAGHRFREDLMYRIRVVPIFLPPLADREGDVVALIWHFIEQMNPESQARGLRTIETISDPAMQALRDYRWPGNVRELRNVVEYAFAVGEGPVLTLDELTPELRGEPPPGASLDEMEPQHAERARLLAALKASGGRKARAAEALGISRSTLWRKLRELGIEG